jgi:hypothetical protein
MIVSSASCPSCGAPVTFKLGSSIVVVCEFCSSAIARTDRDVKNLGKVADLVDTQSPLDVGIEGRYDGKPFVLTGRAQIRHPAGGVWDEWYATFGDGRTGWLAEAQGRFYMTFPIPVADPSLIPPLSSLRPGLRGQVPGVEGSFAVNEVSSARTVAAEGEIPYELVPNEDFFYADLSNEAGGFATIDYGEKPPLVFAGREVTLRDLGIAGAGDEFTAKKRKVGAVRVTCPHCGGPMDLRVPEAERATCPSCNALLDVNQGNLSYLRTLEVRAKPRIPLGAKGAFPEGELTVCGFMNRFCVVEGTRYAWEEYLLYNPQVGFRWLVHDSGHWSYVVPLDAGAVFDGTTSASYHGRHFKQFGNVVAHVESVYGEFYWRVEEGETVWAADFVQPPEILSKEWGHTEVNWSHGTYMARDEVARIFKTERLPEPTAIGMAQPNPHAGKAIPWVVLLLVGIVVGLVVQLSGARAAVLSRSFKFDPLETAAGTRVTFTDPVPLRAWRNVKVTMSSPVDNSWAYIEGDLVDETTGLVQNFSMPIEYYHGVDGGESWSEGSRESTMHLSALPEGSYTLRLEAQWEKWQQPLTVDVVLEQGVPRLLYFGILVGVLATCVGLVLLLQHSFERRRWAESMFNPYESSEEE